jgi:hypothetical protein
LDKYLDRIHLKNNSSFWLPKIKLKTEANYSRLYTIKQ